MESIGLHKIPDHPFVGSNVYYMNTSQNAMADSRINNHPGCYKILRKNYDINYYIFYRMIVLTDKELSVFLLTHPETTILDEYPYCSILEDNGKFYLRNGSDELFLLFKDGDPDVENMNNW